MVSRTNSFEKFWKELKRRKVVHVITVYIAVAFGILQLVDVIVQPLHLPDWTTAFMIVLLCLGFIITVFVSWVYDITPAGIRKTKPAREIKHGDHTAHAVSGGWKIATYVSAIIIVALIAYNFINKRNLNADISKLEKSIAVLPFKSLSTDPEKQYLADGMMEAITLHLSKIKDLRVLGRTSTEQYRNPTKTLAKIGNELGVSYLLEGSFQKFGDNVRLIVQLIKTGKEGHVWANEYNKNWKDVFSVQSEVAQSIARELNAAITPEVKQLIEKIPTSNPTAYDFYQRGMEEFTKYYISAYQNREALDRAGELFRIAIKYDSTFAQAYAGLASAFLKKYLWRSFLSEKNLLDSVLILSNISLKYDGSLSDAYTVRGDYYSTMEMPEEAIAEYDRAIKLNPNDATAYYGKGEVYMDYDLVKSIDNLLKTLSLYHGPLLPSLKRITGNVMLNAGFPEIYRDYLQQAIILDQDSVSHYGCLANIEYCLENFKGAIEALEKAYRLAPDNKNSIWNLGLFNMLSGQYKESLKYFKKLGEGGEDFNDANLFGMHRIGWAYWMNGNKEKADFYFNEQIKYCNKMLELGRVYGDNARIFYDLAGIYAFRGDKAKAFSTLKEVRNKGQAPILWMVTCIKHDPLFDSIRDEPEFQKMVSDYIAKYQAEHERVRKWLEEQGML